MHNIDLLKEIYKRLFLDIIRYSFFIVRIAKWNILFQLIYFDKFQ